MKRKMKSDHDRRSKKQHLGRTQGRSKQTPRKQVDDSTLDVAQSCGRAGVPVLPLYGKKLSGACACRNPKCKRRGKHSRLKEATTDALSIRRCWTERPDDEIGVPLGSASGIVALVIDGTAGEKALRKMKEKRS
jgi:hypothetical protein